MILRNTRTFLGDTASYSSRKVGRQSIMATSESNTNSISFASIETEKALLSFRLASSESVVFGWGTRTCVVHTLFTNQVVQILTSLDIRALISSATKRLLAEEKMQAGTTGIGITCSW